MAGIYIHIPFCKQACHYCDFHFSTSIQYKSDLLSAIAKEIKLQKDYLGAENIETIYFGGGTPSLLSGDEISVLIEEIQKNFKVITNPEITLEANPDDLNLQKLKEFRNTEVNRFSIGVQSFFDEDLKWMNRAHAAVEADHAIKRAQDFGFENLSIDLIYGFSLLTEEKWRTNIEKAVEFQIPHISSYSLTIEPKTALAKFINVGKEKNVDDAQSAIQFQILMETLENNGFEHYEISNFAKPNQYAKHNTNYWKGISYLGIGPSAHSFNKESRQWNVSNNAKYLADLTLNKIPFEKEILSKNDKFNEYLMTSLRTMWGLDLDKIATDFGTDYKNYLLNNTQEFLEKEQLIINNQNIKLSVTGKLYADAIAAELFITEDGF
jgi:oxygen-independent coproporphyrinogen-3 oxidase